MTTAADTEDARAEFAALQKLLPADPRNPALLRDCSRLAVALREYEPAVQFASSALQVVPGDAEATFHLSSALMGLKRFEQAARELAALRSRGLEEAGIDTNLALCHYALGNFAAAQPLLDGLIASGTAAPDVLRLAVSNSHHLGDLATAIAVADAHPQAGMGDGVLAGVYALAYLDAGRPAEASHYATRALAANPDSIDGLTVQATLGAANLESAAAERQFRRILDMVPQNGRAWIGLGILALLAQDLPGAIQHLERGVAAMPGHVGSWQVLGWAYLVAGNLDAAERVLRHALDMDRNFAEAHGAMASLFALRGWPAEARAEIALADRLDRGGLAARFADAVLLGRGDPAAGQALIRETIAGLVPRLGSRAAHLFTVPTGAPFNTRH
jgi:Flp pilus assembly protein TadD